MNRPESYIQTLSVPDGSKQVSDDDMEITAVAETKMHRPLSLASLNLEAPPPQDGRRTGDMSVYWYYMKILGIWRSLIFVLLICCYVVGISFPSKFCQTYGHSGWADWYSDLGGMVDGGELRIPE